MSVSCALSACGSGVQSGTVEEFCADWAIVEPALEAKDAAAIATALHDVRFPEAIQEDAAATIDRLEEDGASGDIKRTDHGGPGALLTYQSIACLPRQPLPGS